MNLLDLTKHPVVNRRPVWRGQWARVWLQPSIFSAQKFIVGAIALDDSGLCDFRFITGTDKFACVYGDAERDICDQLITAARQRLSQAREKHEPITNAGMPPGLDIEPVGLASGASPSEALEKILSEAEIPMEPKEEEGRLARFKSRNAAEITAAVMNAVKARLGFDASDVLREDFFGDETHSARVNLIKPTAAGLIASGWYAGAERVQLELLKAATTVEGYMALHDKGGEPGVFFLRPSEGSGLRVDQAVAIENALDDVTWKLERKGLRVATQDNEIALAEDIVAWAEA